MTNTIVTTDVAAVNLAEATAHADTLFAAWEQAVATQQAAWEASIAAKYSPASLEAVSVAVAAVSAAHAAWKVAEAAVRTATADEAAYDAMLCAQFDAMDNAVEYPHHYDDAAPIPYVITSYGYTYLDHHYQTHTSAGAELEF